MCRVDDGGDDDDDADDGDGSDDDGDDDADADDDGPLERLLSSSSSSCFQSNLICDKKA